MKNYQKIFMLSLIVGITTGGVKGYAQSEPQTHTINAILKHTASAAKDVSVGTTTIDSDFEYFNQSSEGYNWASAAFAKFSYHIPDGVEIKKATLTWSAKDGRSGDRFVNIYYLTEDKNFYTWTNGATITVDEVHSNLYNGEGEKNQVGEEYKIERSNDLLNATTDVTEVIKQYNDIGSIVFQWLCYVSNANDGAPAYLYGKNSSNPPTLTIECENSYGNRTWAIFEETAMSSFTWNSLSVHDDIENVLEKSGYFSDWVEKKQKNNPTTWEPTGWVPRGTTCFKRIEAFYDEEIKVNGKTLFPGVYFTASANTYNGDDGDTESKNYKDAENIGSLEIAPKTYRILVNNSGIDKDSDDDDDYKSYFKLPNVPEGYYIWIEALTNEKNPSNGVNFTLTGTQYGGTVTRYDAEGDEKELEKHMFCYKVNKTDDYMITPSRACYIYYIAIKPDPIPVLKLETNSYTKNFGNTFSVIPTCYINNVEAFSHGTIEYFSDDNTVITVDENGMVTCVGKGEATITATIKAGSDYTVDSSASADGNKNFTSDHEVTVSYTVTVEDDRVISYNKLDGTAAPQLWESWDCKRGGEENGETLIKMYIGGWKYQKPIIKENDKDADKAKKGLQTTALADLYLNTSENYTGDSKPRTDLWTARGTWSLGKESVKEYQTMPMDGFGPYTYGTDNGKSEFLYTSLLWESDYVGRFSTREDNGENGNGNPFTVPCMGDFVKFEPEVNGTVTLYVLQNGCIDSNDNYQLVGKIAWRPVYIVDESGTCLSDDEVKAVTKQRTMFSRTDKTTDVYDADSDDANYVDMPFADAIKVKSDIDKTTGVNIYETHKDVFDNSDYWSRRGTYEKVLGPKITSSTPKGVGFTVQTGGWVVITKSYVKYQFPVKAGKSYYVFSNKAKLGICGYTFLPDDEQEEINNGNVIAEYKLSENKTDNTDAYEKLNDLLKEKGKVTVKEMTVEHTFHQGWNAICLPFSITESKMRELFGSKTVAEGANKDKKMEDYELVLFNGSEDLSDTSNKAYFFHHVYQDIIAGYPYMIYLNKDAYVLSEEYKGSFTVKNVTLENVKTSVNDISITTSEDYMPAGSGFEDNATSTDFTFKGVYAPEDVPEGSYLVVNTGFRIYKPTTLPGYRSYLHPSYSNPAKPDETEAKRITANNLSELGFFWDEANPIKDIMADAYGDDTNGRMQPTNVYHASGMLVRKGTTSLDGLPKGVYIVNGKKILK